MWLDEAQSLAIARLPLGQLFEALRHDGSPPLYYLLLRSWAAVFGTGDLALRSLSGICSVLALPLMWWAGRRLGGPRLGAVALLVLAFNPWALRYATESRMYSLLALLVLLSGYALDRALVSRRRRDVLLLGLVCGLTLLTHYWAFFLLAVVAALLAYAGVRSPAHRSPALRGLVGLGLGVLLFLPWAPSFLYQISHTGAPWADPPGLTRLTTLPLEWSGADVPTARWMVLLLWPLLVLGAAAVPAQVRTPRLPGAELPGLARMGSGRLLAAVALATLLLALLVTRLTGSGVEVRYTAIVVPLVLLVVSLGVVALPGRWAAAALAGLVGLGLIAGLETARLPRTQAKEIAATLDRFGAPGDVVLYCPDQLGPPVERLLHTTDLTRVPVPTGAPPSIIDWVDYDARVERTNGDDVAADAVSRAGTATVWLLTSPRYRTHRKLCGDVREGLLRRGSRPRVAVSLNSDAYEYAILERWTPGPERPSAERILD